MPEFDKHEKMGNFRQLPKHGIVWAKTEDSTTWCGRSVGQGQNIDAQDQNRPSARMEEKGIRQKKKLRKDVAARPGKKGPRP